MDTRNQIQAVSIFLKRYALKNDAITKYRSSRRSLMKHKYFRNFHVFQNGVTKQG